MSPSTRVPLELNDAALHIAEWRDRAGFTTPASIAPRRCGITEATDGDLMLGKLMLVVSEVSEAAEAVRKNSPENFVEEIADTMIRLLDICGTMGIDIEAAIRLKMAINAARPARHGKETNL